MEAKGNQLEGITIGRITIIFYTMGFLFSVFPNGDVFEYSDTMLYSLLTYVGVKCKEDISLDNS